MMAGQVYAWCEVTYLDELSPDETYTVRKPMPVATHEEYLALLIIQKSKRFQAMHSKLMHDIKQKYASATLVEQDLHVKHAGIDPKFVKDFLRYLEQIKSMK